MPHINPNHGQNAINSMGTLLPQYIHGLYYYDYIGNISTSHAAREDEYVNFHLEPRFPIFGQWKTDWNQGYNMPTKFHLFQSSKNRNEHTLEVDFMHAFDKSLTEDYAVRVILPEGAKNIKVELPSNVNPDSIEMSKFFGTLDYFGRPEILIKKANVVHDLNDVTLKVHYTFNNGVDIFLEPVCMFALLFATYLVVISYSIISLDLKNKKIPEKSKMN